MVLFPNFSLPLLELLLMVILLIAGSVVNRFPYLGYVNKFAKFMVSEMLSKLQ